MAPGADDGDLGTLPTFLDGTGEGGQGSWEVPEASDKRGPHMWGEIEQQEGLPFPPGMASWNDSLMETGGLREAMPSPVPCLGVPRGGPG